MKLSNSASSIAKDFCALASTTSRLSCGVVATSQHTVQTANALLSCSSDPSVRSSNGRAYSIIASEIDPISKPPCYSMEPRPVHSTTRRVSTERARWPKSVHASVANRQSRKLLYAIHKSLHACSQLCSRSSAMTRSSRNHKGSVGNGWPTISACDHASACEPELVLESPLFLRSFNRRRADRELPGFTGTAGRSDCATWSWSRTHCRNYSNRLPTLTSKPGRRPGNDSVSVAFRIIVSLSAECR